MARRRRRALGPAEVPVHRVGTGVYWGFTHRRKKPIARKKEAGLVVQRPHGTNPFEFVVVSGLRAAQLMRGCIPRVERAHKVITTAQIEVATGKVSRIPVGENPVVVE